MAQVLSVGLGKHTVAMLVSDDEVVIGDGFTKSLSDRPV